eukprot:3834584-Amphidinium_carterae.1
MKMHPYAKEVLSWRVSLGWPTFATGQPLTLYALPPPCVGCWSTAGPAFTNALRKPYESLGLSSEALVTELAVIGGLLFAGEAMLCQNIVNAGLLECQPRQTPS